MFGSVDISRENMELLIGTAPSLLRLLEAPLLLVYDTKLRVLLPNVTMSTQTRSLAYSREKSGANASRTENSNTPTT
jgi:hypothetical protein